jgi:CheY-like chemotaxis protein
LHDKKIGTRTCRAKIQENPRPRPAPLSVSNSSDVSEPQNIGQIGNLSGRVDRPLNVADANQTIACPRKAQHLSSHIPPNPFSDLTIVVVEDHDDARRYLGLFLDQLGANVLLARNASEGLDAIKNNLPNLVLSDINMPGMDGFELLREIRALGSDAGGSVPVISMTALVTHADRARMLNAGFQACLPKPFTPAKLQETILTVLDK